MSKEVLQQYISEQLIKFCYESRCCMKFLGFLFTFDRTHFIKSLQDLRLRMHTYVFNGQESVIVFKDCCHHVIDDGASLKLCPDTVKDMYVLHCGLDFGGSQEEIQMSTEFLSPANSVPNVPPHRFSLGPLKQSLARRNPQGQMSYQKDCPLQPYKDEILNSLSRNRVLVVNGGPTFDKSAAIPMYIIDKCAEDKLHCKIICVEREQLVAIYNSERLAEHFQEKVGETVAYQVQLQSRISDSSNLVYTTSSFLLRVLMGQSIMDSFRHISHVVVVDVHLHEAFADLLLRELKEALKYHPHLKVVLLSNSQNNTKFLTYFGEGEELSLQPINGQLTTKNPKVLYIDDVRRILPESRISNIMTKAFRTLSITNSNGINLKQLDRCLEAYERSSSDQCIDTFLYMIHGECAEINHRHSVTGRTAIIIASLLGKVNHVKTLLQLEADPLICDNQNMNALKAAISMGNRDCVELLKMAYFEQTTTCMDSSKDCIDYHLIIDIIQMITSNENWKNGNIIVFLPSYQHLIKLNYGILKQKLLGNVPEHLRLFLLHNYTEKAQLDAIIVPSKNIKLILATDIAETLICFDDIQYVIDAARHCRCVFNNDAKCKENLYEWASKQSLENRKLLLNKDNDGVCFRLITESVYDKLVEVHPPELLTMPLDRVCLSVKLLSPNSMVAEYLQETIVRPPFMQIFRSVEFLRKINVFTDLEDITWLGCRLIDVPVECYLGKLLVFAIMLQCLDPVLTIVGFMTTLDPLELTNYIDNLVEPHKDLIRSKIKQERTRLSEGHLSDHLMYLRLYQEWQNDLRDEDSGTVLNEYHFILNGLLEHVCNVRTQLVGALRSSQLIHSKGNLSMHYINIKSNCWPVIKAALVGGLYPNICMADANTNRIKSPCKRELILHPNSVLREMDLNSIKPLDFVTPWIIYGKETNSWNSNSIQCNTVVAPITIAMFAGPTKMPTSSIQIIQSGPANNRSCYFHIDDWISFACDYKEAQLLLKTRQYFYSVYVNYLQYCGFLEKYKRPNISLVQNVRLFECLEKILVQEDIAYGFIQPERVGLRPKALPNQFLMGFNASILLTTTCYKPNNTQQLTKHLEKQFFMVYQMDSMDSSNIYPDNEWYHQLTKMLTPKMVVAKLTFVISYSRNPDYLKSLSVVEWRNGILKLHSCFKYDIKLQNILKLISCNVDLSLAINKRRIAFQIDNNTGEFIMNLFATRNNWLHN